MLDYVMMNPPGLVFDGAGGGGPSVYTLTLDDLNTRFAEYNQAPASIKFKLTNGVWTTDDIYLDNSNGSGNALNTIVSHTDLATRIENALEAATGNGNRVTVSSEFSEAGDRYDFTITFDVFLGAVTLSFGASQWYPTIALVETVDAEGVADIPAASAQVQVTASGANDTTTDTEGNFVSLDAGEAFQSATPGIGWTGVGSSNPVTFTRVATELWDSTGYGVNSGSGSVAVITNGSDEIPGSAEVHTITPQPVVPTGGTWKPGVNGAAVNHNANTTAIANQSTATGWSLVSSVTGTLNAGAVTITNGVNGDVGDLAPVNVDLTAPEITHSITPA